MDVSSSLTGPKEFRIVKRGYDPDEVDAFLDQISLGVAELKRKLAEAGDKAAAAPPPPPAPVAAPNDEVEEIHRALILAQRAADEEVRKATEEAEAIRADARSAADEVQSSADAQAAEARRAIEEEVARRREEGRAGLLSEISELEGVRDSLASDVIVLERHVDEQREVVQAAIGELQSLLDHPEAFRVAMAPGVSTGPALPPDVVGERLDAAARPSAAASAPERLAAVPSPAPPVESEGAPTSEPATDDLLVGPPPGPSSAEAFEVVEEGPPLRASPGGPEALAFPDDPTPTEAAPPEAADEPEIDLSGDDVVADAAAAPPTEAMAAAEGPENEDAFLAELRKAMLDDAPLGPREEGDLNPIAAAPDDESGRGRPRFGRRK